MSQNWIKEAQQNEKEFFENATDEEIEEAVEEAGYGKYEGGGLGSSMIGLWKFDSVTVNEDRLGGTPCLRGTRIPAHFPIQYFAHGLTVTDFSDQYRLDEELVHEFVSELRQALELRHDDANDPDILPPEDETQTVWAAQVSRGPEDGLGVISLHQTKESAEAAVEQDKARAKKEHQELYSDPEVGPKPFPYDHFKGWEVTEMEVQSQ